MKNANGEAGVGINVKKLADIANCGSIHTEEHTEIYDKIASWKSTNKDNDSDEHIGEETL